MKNLTPLHPRFGVEIHDMDLSQLTDAQFSDLRAAFERHSVLLFRNQTITDDDHIALARRFGPIEDRNADTRPKDAPPVVAQVSNVRADGSLSGEMDMHTLHLKANMLWHCDSTFLPVPALSNILIGRVVTEHGGQTELASTRAGWADMPDPLRAQIRDRVIWHRYAHSRARISPELAKMEMFQKWKDQAWRAVWTNPVTKDEALYIASHAFAVDGLDPDTGANLIDSLINFVTQPEYVLSHTWNVGDVLVWDQRAVLHRATPWDYGAARKLSSLCTSVTPADGLEEMRPTVPLIGPGG
ncbi:MAG: TauD/TfdA dioxygenase family protein [Sedimentitalea sp.]